MAALSWRQLAALAVVLGLNLDIERRQLKETGAYLEPYLAPHRIQREAGNGKDNHDDYDHSKHDGTLSQPSARARDPRPTDRLMIMPLLTLEHDRFVRAVGC